MPESVLRLHHFEPRSRANGPGLRSVLWLQGCTLSCPGCFNPLTYAKDAGQLVPLDAIFRQIVAQSSYIEGITVSGGEPLQQAQALVELMRTVKRETDLSILLFSGFTWEEVKRLPEASAILECVDVLLAGRYQANLRIASGLRGSSNKTIHLLSSRYTAEEIETVPPAEVIIGPNGEVRFSGIEPLRW
jgi:anaerobic ribonucleoside-triphosphate reductase activating protein